MRPGLLQLGAFAFTAMALGGCADDPVCYERQRMPEYGSILRAVPCDKTTGQADDRSTDAY